MSWEEERELREQEEADERHSVRVAARLGKGEDAFFDAAAEQGLSKAEAARIVADMRDEP